MGNDHYVICIKFTKHVINTSKQEKYTKSLEKLLLYQSLQKKKSKQNSKRYHPREKCKKQSVHRTCNVDLLFGCVFNCTAIIKDSHQNDLDRNNLMHWISVLKGFLGLKNLMQFHRLKITYSCIADTVFRMD